jgi:hypothetical protein
MSNRVRTTDDGLARIRASIGASTFHGITVQGHCMGIVARTWRLPSQPAGYGTAFDGAQAVQRAGRLRAGQDPPVGALAWWAHRTSDNRPGHVATINRPGHCLGNVGATIQEARLSQFGNLRWLGWSWPADVPGWGTNPDPGDDMPLTNDDVDRIARRVWEFIGGSETRTTYAILRNLARDAARETWASQWREYLDENGNGTREDRTASDILFSTHAASVRADRQTRG